MFHARLDVVKFSTGLEVQVIKICMTLIDLSRSLKVIENGAKWNFIYDFLSVNNNNYCLILHRFRDMSQNSVMGGGKILIWPPCRHICSDLAIHWHIHCPSYTPSFHQIWKKSGSFCLSYCSKCVYIQDGHHAAILTDVKNIFDLPLPWTVPDHYVMFHARLCCYRQLF